MSLTDLQPMERTLIMNKKAETNQQRITRLLAGNSISDGAREYISGLVETHGVEGCAMLTHNDQIGLSVFEDENGDQTLYYDGYGDGREYIEACYCDIKDILDVAEAKDEVPQWWPEEAIVTSVYCNHNGYGSRLTIKGCT